MISKIKYPNGWRRKTTGKDWGNFNEISDNLHDFWKGEDLDFDEAVDAGDWGNGTGLGKVNCSNPDSIGDNIFDDMDLTRTVNGTVEKCWSLDFDNDSLPCALDANSDGDSLTDDVDTNPLGTDGDGDGISDGFDPDQYNSDIDGDGILDGYEGNGRWNADFDGDGYANFRDPDSDGDGLADGENTTWASGSANYTIWHGMGIAHFDVGSDTTFLGEGANDTDPWNPDTDRDGLWDGPNPTGTINYTGWMRLGKTRFFVMDGKPYGEYRNFDISGFDIVTRGELSFGSDPNAQDTDDDGLTDGEEVCGYFTDDFLVPDTEYVAGTDFTASPTAIIIDPAGWVKFPLPIDSDSANHSFILALTFAAYDEINPAETNISITLIGTNYSMATSKHIFPTDSGYGFYPYVENRCPAASAEYCYAFNVPCGIFQTGIYYLNISINSGTGIQSAVILGNIFTLCRDDFGADPILPDTDADGLNDPVEIDLGTSMLRDNSDRDNYYDGADLNPLDRDLDRDGLTYPRERYYGTNHRIADCDNDSLNDYLECVEYGTDPLFNDTDFDGLTDGYEIYSSRTNPNNPNTDNDSWTDYEEVRMGLGFSANSPNVLGWAICLGGEEIKGMDLGLPGDTLYKSLNAVQELGASFIRIDFSWNDIQPTQTDWNTDRYHLVVNACKSRGIGVIAVLGAAGHWPWWVKHSAKIGVDYGGTFFYSRISTNWINYCSKIAQEFGEDINFYQILNEENHIANEILRLEDEPDAINDAHDAISRWDEYSQIIFNVHTSVPAGESWTAHIENVLWGANGSIDIIAIDHYPGTYTYLPTWDNYNALDELITLCNKYSKQGAIMETGYSSWGEGMPKPFLGYWHSEDDQENWINEFLPIIYSKVKQQNSISQNKILFATWYTLRASGLYGPIFIEDNFGILRDDWTKKCGFNDLHTRIEVFYQ